MGEHLEILARCRGFEWYEHNAEKILNKHTVAPTECEQVFLNRPLVVADDTEHSQKEGRFYALGQTDAERELFMVFTLRGEMIRVISARDMSRKERRAYQHYEKKEEGS